MAAAKRPQKSKITGQVETMKSVSQHLESPIKLDPAETTYFNILVKGRESSSWDSNDLLLAANLAITLVQLDDANIAIAEGGFMVRSPKGTPVPNPAIAAKTSLTSTILQMNKHLGLSASQKGLSGSAQESRNKADSQARAIIDKIASEDLLA
jgi:phage terminase small subunit